MLRAIPRQHRAAFLKDIHSILDNRAIRRSYGNRGGSTGSCGVVELTGLEYVATPAQYRNMYYPKGDYYAKDAVHMSPKLQTIIAYCMTRRIIRMAYSRFLWYDNPPTLTFFSSWGPSLTSWKIMEKAGFHIRLIGKSTHGEYRLAMAIWIPPNKHIYKRIKGQTEGRGGRYD